MLHESRDKLLAWCLAYKVFNKYLLNGWKNGWNNEWTHHFVHWLESFVGSAISLFSTVLDGELLRRAESKLVWSKSAAYLSFYKTDPKEAAFYSTNRWGSRLCSLPEWLIRVSHQGKDTSCSQMLISGWGKVTGTKRRYSLKKPTNLFKKDICKIKDYFFLNN